MKKIVITGPTGAIGHALIEECMHNHCEVYAICRPGSMRIEGIPKVNEVHIVECDLAHLDNAKDQLPDCCDVFYHFGWSGTTGQSRDDMYLQNDNIHYTLDAVSLAHELGCKVFIGAGSQAEYGRAEGILTSNTPTFPENGYGMAKLCAGMMSRIKCRQYGIKHIWTRILSVYGPYDGEKTMIMSAIFSLLKGECPKFTKGEQQWDYLYSKDAGAIMFALAEKGKDGQIYCLGSGKARTLSEYIYIIRDVINKELSVGIGEIPYSPGQVMYLCADTSPILNEIQYQYRYTFESGIRETIRWCEERIANEKAQCYDSLL